MMYQETDNKQRVVDLAVEGKLTINEARSLLGLAPITDHGYGQDDMAMFRVLKGILDGGSEKLRNSFCHNIRAIVIGSNERVPIELDISGDGLRIDEFGKIVPL